MKKKAIIVATVIIVLVVAVIAVISFMNNKKAEAIYNNFLGTTFSGSVSDDNDFYNDYRSGNINEYKTYYLEKKQCTLAFNEDGTVEWKKVSDSTVLAYPKVIAKPQGYHYEDEGDFESFEVSVSLGGDVTIKLGSDYEVSVDDKGNPTKIWGFKDVDVQKR